MRRGRLLDDLAHALLRQLIERREDAVARTILRDDEGVVPLAARVREEIIARFHVGLRRREVETELTDGRFRRRAQGGAAGAVGAAAGGGAAGCTSWVLHAVRASAATSVGALKTSASWWEPAER